MLLGKRRGKIKELKCIKNAPKSEEERGKESKPVLPGLKCLYL